MYSIEQLSNIIEQAIQENNLKWQKQNPVNLYQPVSYTMEAGGKRLRPLLVLLGHQMFDNDVKVALPAALAVEVFHNFTLLHDDIMDKAEIRRGLPAVHIRFSENAAILSGDAMAFLSYRFLIQSPGEKVPRLAQLFTQTALEVCEGQQLDMDFETRTDVTTSEYISMIRLKTSVLLGCALKCGAITGGAPVNLADQLYEIGINMGIAFQLQDDYLDTFGDEEKFGKKIGGDILSNKKTFLLLQALTMASEMQKKELDRWLVTKDYNADEKIKAVKDIFTALNIQKLTREKISEYTRLAINSLQTLPVDDHHKEYLLKLCKSLEDRKV